MQEINNYEDYLRRAYAEGWRDPIQVSDLEISAYCAGVEIERKRVLAIFKGISDGRPMRAIDLQQYINRITKTGNDV
jgi:hypothetical protein